MRMMGVLYFGLLALCVLVTGFRMPSIDAAAANSKIDLSTKIETAMKELSSKVETAIKDLSTKMDIAVKDLKSDNKELSTKMDIAVEDLKSDNKELSKDLKSDYKELSTKMESDFTVVRTALKTLNARVIFLVVTTTFIFLVLASKLPFLEDHVSSFLKLFHLWQ